MYAQDISLNIMSLGGIALAIGMLVDNAIVVLENIARYKEQGMAPMEAAKKGASEVSMAITASTLTTVAVFFPLVFVEGVAGQLFKDQALTVTYALLASLLVALTLIPAMAAREGGSNAASGTTSDAAPTQAIRIKPERWYLWPLVPFHLLYLGVRFVFLGLFTLLTILFRALSKALSFIFNPLLNVVQAFLRALESGYRAVLKTALKAKTLVLVFTVVSTALIYTLIPRLGFDVIPSMSQGEFYVEVQLPVGSAIDRTDKVLKQLAVMLRRVRASK
jgi:HAE1 family hydrophobic/amphiphilic exporter-1